jgi:DNA segregation ATPase FtsK/SpoIIIE-like protein
VRDPEPDASADPACQDMARRFAPSRDEPSGARGFGLLRRRAGAGSERADDRDFPARKPVWPGSVPAQADGDMAPAAPYPPEGAEDQLYGRAVAIVRAQRKASTAYLQQSLGIRYMRAADLIERMEREGIVGAPVQNGVRPILGTSARWRVV